MTEWPIVPVLKTGSRRKAVRGFESHSFLRLPDRLTGRTAPFEGAYRGSNPLRATNGSGPLTQVSHRSLYLIGNARGIGRQSMEGDPGRRLGPPAKRDVQRKLHGVRLTRLPHRTQACLINER